MKAHAGAALLLERHGIFASPVNASGENLSLLESVPPNWLDLNEFYARVLIAEAGNLQGAELKTCFKNGFAFSLPPRSGCRQPAGLCVTVFHWSFWGSSQRVGCSTTTPRSVSSCIRIRQKS